jgi:hypothetical protein
LKPSSKLFIASSSDLPRLSAGAASAPDAVESGCRRRFASGSGLHLLEGLVDVHRRFLPEAARDQRRERDDETDHDDLDDHERHGPPIDLSGRDLGDRLARDLVVVVVHRRHASQVKKGKTEGRVHERRLHVHGEQHAEPDQIDAELLGHGADQRNHDERELEEIEEECEQEDQDVDDDQEAELAARQAGQQVLDPHGPSTAWNDKLNTVEPIRMKRTKHDSFIVESIA